MNLYFVYRDFAGYDTCDSIVVCAESEDRARQIQPEDTSGSAPCHHRCTGWGDLKDPKDLKVQLIGKALDHFVEEKCICSSYNDG